MNRILTLVRWPSKPTFSLIGEIFAIKLGPVGLNQHNGNAEFPVDKDGGELAVNRDGMLRSGMEHGVNDSYERLDELLAKGSTAKTVSQ